MNADGVVQSDGREAHELRRSMHPPAAPLARRHVTVSEFEEWLAEGGEGLPPKFEASDVDRGGMQSSSCMHGGAGLSGVHGVGPRARIHARPSSDRVRRSLDRYGIIAINRDYIIARTWCSYRVT